MVEAVVDSVEVVEVLAVVELVGLSGTAGRAWSHGGLEVTGARGVKGGTKL